MHALWTACREKALTGPVPAARLAAGRGAPAGKETTPKPQKKKRCPPRTARFAAAGSPDRRAGPGGLPAAAARLHGDESPRAAWAAAYANGQRPRRAHGRGRLTDL